MKIGGLNKFSLSDFPGKISAVVFTQGCNFRCPYCHNGSLIPLHVPNDLLIPEEEFFRFLNIRGRQLDAVVVSGGEPTIQPGLFTLLWRIKSMGFLVKLDTNGSRPKVLRGLLNNKLLDYVAMDVKAPLHIYNCLTGTVLPVIREIQESIALISKSGIDHEFRTTVVELLLWPEDIRSIQKLIPPGSTHRLQDFCPEHALDPALRKYTNAYVGDSWL